MTNNIAVIKMLTDLQTLTRDQSFPTLIHKGPLPPQGDDVGADSAPSSALQTGADRILNVGDGDISILAPDASVSDIQGAADTLAERTYDDACVSSIVKSAEAESGYALKVKRAPYLNKMKTKRGPFRKADEKLIELAALIQEVGFSGTPATLSEDFKVSSNYDDSQLTPEDPDSQRENDKFDSEMQLVSRIDLIQQRYQVSREEAEQIAKRIDLDNEAGGTTGVGLNELSLGAQRLASAGDVDGYNTLRQETLKQVGETDLPPVKDL